MDHIVLRDGRRLDYRLSGPEDGMVFVFHHGTPGAGTERRSIEGPAHERGLRVLTTSRPGYGDSTRHPGRAVVDVVDDIAQLLDSLGIEECLVGGWSGGGPHALACAARLETARAALVVAGVGVFDADGLDFLAGMGPENIEEFGAAVDGEAPLRTYLEGEREQMGEVSVNSLIATLDGLLPPVDRAVLSHELGEDMVASMEEAIRTGVDGWLDDDLAFVSPWGFDLSEVSTPVSLWQGDVDLMVPFTHGAWLAGQVPTATVHLEEGEGHLSMAVGAVGDMLDEVMALAT